MNGFWANHQAIVTGGSGMLARHVTSQLRQSGCVDVFVATHADYELTDPGNVAALFDRAKKARKSNMPFVVFHIAGKNGGIGANRAAPADFLFKNALLNLLVIDQACRSGCSAIVAAGAGAGYPETARSPLVETDYWEGFPNDDLAPYGIAKRLLDVQGRAYFAQYRIPIVTAILGNLYGPHDNFSDTAPVIPALIKRFVDAVKSGADTVSPWGTGRATRDFCFAPDAAGAMMLAAEKCGRSEAINVSSGVENSISEAVTCIARAANFKGTIEWDDSKPEGQLARRLDTRKASRVLGWQASTRLDIGIQLTVDWYQNSGHG